MDLLSDAGYCARSIISKEDSLPYNTPMICEAGISRAHIESDGSLSGCQFIAHHPSAVVGNIKDGFLRLWLEGDWSFYRKAAPVNEICARCAERKYCVRNCLALGDAMFEDAKMLSNHACDSILGG
jgi:radical SAM protein with 4Fe4S-binding SPASM domain